MHTNDMRLNGRGAYPAIADPDEIFGALGSSNYPICYEHLDVPIEYELKKFDDLSLSKPRKSKIRKPIVSVDNR